MEIKKYLLSLFVLYSFSCFSAPPQWIDDRPSNSEYWHGIGFTSYSILDWAARIGDGLSKTQKRSKG